MKKYIYSLLAFNALFISHQVAASGVTIELDTTVTMDSFTYTDDSRIVFAELDFGGGAVVSDSGADGEILVDPLDDLIRLSSNIDIGNLDDLDSDSDGYMNYSENLLDTSISDASVPSKTDNAFSFLTFLISDGAETDVNVSESQLENELVIVNDNPSNNSWTVVDLTANDNEQEPEYVLEVTPTSINQNVFLHWIPEVTGDIYFEARVVGDDSCCAINAFINEQGYGDIPLSSSDGWVKFQLETGGVFSGKSFITSFGLSVTSETATNSVVQIRRLFASKVASDSDKDGLPDRDEMFFGLNPATPFLVDEEGNLQTDSNGNYLPDLTVDAQADYDSDGLTNIQEYGTDSNWTVADTDNDGTIDSKDDLPSNDQETVDTDGDGLGNKHEDSDDDNDRIPDDVENQYSFLDPLKSEDGKADYDSDGVSNTQEYLNGTSFTYDDYGPLISGAPNVLRVKSTGDLTGVDFSDVTAFDGKERDPVAVWQKGEKQTVFAPGTHSVTWVAYDGPGDGEGNPNGNKTELTQTIIVLPLIRFEESKLFVDEQGENADQGSVCLTLNAVSPTYPVEVELSLRQTIQDISGLVGLIDENILFPPETVSEEDGTTDEEQNDSASEEDTNQESALTPAVTDTLEVVFQEGETRACADYNFSDFALGLDTDKGTSTTALIKVKDGDRLSFLGNDALEVIKNDALKLPILTLSSSQGDVKGRTFFTGQGNITVSLGLENINASEATIDWSATDAELIDLDSDPLTFTFDPSIVASGLYTVKVGALESASLSLPTVVDISLQLLENTGDVVIREDLDLDGIPDEDELVTAQYMLSTVDLGVKAIVPSDMTIKLGDEALELGAYSPEMSFEDFENVTTEVVEDEEIVVSSVLSFVVSGLPQPGMQVPVVIKLDEPLERTSGYYKLKEGVWVPFDESTGDKLMSTNSVEGVCPDPGVKYNNGLRKGSDCIKLLIKDGGPNDDDQIINGVIKDPGAIGPVPAADVVDSDGGRKKPSKMSGGAFPYYLLIIVLMISSRRTLRQLFS